MCLAMNIGVCTLIVVCWAHTFWIAHVIVAEVFSNLWCLHLQWPQESLLEFINLSLFLVRFLECGSVLLCREQSILPNVFYNAPLHFCKSRILSSWDTVFATAAGISMCCKQDVAAHVNDAHSICIFLCRGVAVSVSSFKIFGHCEVDRLFVEISLESGSRVLAWKTACAVHCCLKNFSFL